MSSLSQFRSMIRGLACVASLALLPSPAFPAGAADETLIYLDQGPDWTAAARSAYYTQDQGSRLVPLAWLEALGRADGQPFLADSLARYGYLPNPASGNRLPVGFAVAGPQGSEVVGLTCAACHTRQIEVGGKAYRIDGGPAFSDIYNFFADLDAAVGRVLASEATFKTFAAAVLHTSAPKPDDVAALRKQVEAWHLPYHTIMAGALPKEPWGIARLDAVGMIFNRIIGLDIGPPPTYMIPENIKVAKAPTRYPFLWNAPRQDRTQWSGFLNNGNDTLSVPRNLGQVYGTFGEFHPVKDTRWWNILRYNYLAINSANFGGLDALETLVKRLGPPRWPWSYDAALAAKGKEIYGRSTTEGGCVDCHGIKPGLVQFPDVQTWATPLQDVGTDSAQYEILRWKAKTGVLQGAEIPHLREPLGETDYALNVLATSVLGAIIQNRLFPSSGADEMGLDLLAKLRNPPPSLEGLKGAYSVFQDLRAIGRGLETAAPVYEARVMEGIWAAAPYLHNGSVPTLAELLKPAAERVASFAIGPAYDTQNVGVAVEQTKFGYTLTTTDCANRSSGNSRCGHEYGTWLKPEEKKALLEYLKVL
jgi:mono/diheme cytochrome c family protein